MPPCVPRTHRAALWLALLGSPWALGACKSGGSPDASQRDRAAQNPVERSQADAEPPAPQTREPGVGADGTVVSAVQWFGGTLEQAIARAGATNQSIFMDVGAYWCPPCHEMDEKTFVDDEIGTLLSEQYVSLHIDAEKGEGPDIVERYDVQAFPTLLVLEPTGNERGRLVDFHDPAALREGLERIQAGRSALEALESRVAGAPDDLELEFELAHAYAMAAQRDKAQPLYDEILREDVGDARGLASRVAYDRALLFTYNLDDDGERAIAQLRQVQEDYPGSKSAVWAYKHIARILNSDGKTEQAIQTLDALAETKPAGDPGIASTYGWFCFREKAHPKRGLEVVRASLDEHGDWPDLHYLAAELSSMTGDRKAAVTHIKAAQELEPKSHFYRRQVVRFEAIAKGEPDPEGVGG